MLAEGDKAPGFTLRDQDGNPVRLADFAGRGLIIYFYPRAFTPGCTTEACDLRDRHDAFLQAGWNVVGISPDPPARLAEFRRKHNLPFPLLSDPDHRVAELYGAWGKKTSYGRETTGLIRSTFAVAPNGRLQAVWRSVRATGHAQRIGNQLGLAAS